MIAFDEHYLVPACNVLNSLGRSLPPAHRPSITIVLPADVSQSTKQRLVSHAVDRGLRVETQLVRQDLSTLPTVSYFTVATYFRLLLPDLLPEARRVIYLDVDLIVMRDVTNLLEVELGDAPLAAVRDSFIPLSRVELPGFGEELPDLPRNRRYFNSGVMVINAEVWREERIGPRALELIRDSTPPPTYLDQDALNILTAGRWKELDWQWNVFPVSDRPLRHANDPFVGQFSMGEQVRMERSASILHFAGPSKPWDEGYPQTANLELYQRFTR